ncbi:hypothetical protein ADIWIN_0303 [Winogradskyella psychrotolerans RS-3]|uniref:Uncharacterized protein n=1 Tax=Winogradskyella psychrotolerans RS-3 TaxID=641526 RepID=S7X6J0_9FLAO|nr:hypothetical protein ADIWIN_0303 [Winogradskyella psychrotolerans RS-3]
MLPPTVMGSLTVLELASKAVHPASVSEKFEYVPAANPVNEKLLAEMVTFCGLVVAPAPVGVKLKE